MDYNNYNPYDNSGDNQQNSSSNPNNYHHNYDATPRPVINIYEKIAFALGISSILSCGIIYISFMTGSMAILFAILSKGGSMKFGSKAKLGAILGVIGLILTIIFYTIAFQIALAEYGSIEGILREACELLGYDFEMLYGQFFQQNLAIPPFPLNKV